MSLSLILLSVERKGVIEILCWKDLPKEQVFYFSALCWAFIHSLAYLIKRNTQSHHVPPIVPCLSIPKFYHCKVHYLESPTQKRTGNSSWESRLVLLTTEPFPQPLDWFSYLQHIISSLFVAAFAACLPCLVFNKKLHCILRGLWWFKKERQASKL